MVTRHKRCALAVLVAAMATPEPTTAQVPFTEEAVARGVNYVVTQGDWALGFGCGIALVDLDGDGDVDLVVSGRADGAVGVYENTGTGVFTGRTDTALLDPLPSASSVLAADYDGDGLLDLFFTQWNGPNKLYKNMGGFSFQDVTATAGVGDAGRGQGAAFGDYDGDGSLDLYVANRIDASVIPAFGVNRFYRNKGNGQFEEIGAAAGVDDGGAGFSPVFFDYDLDGDVDLYLSNDKGGPIFHNQLWKNVGGAFVNVSAESGAGVIGFLMGVAIGDLDRNGHPDIYTTNMNGNPLLLNQGDGTFLQAQVEAGVASFEIGWASLFWDYDNDGDEDLYLVNSLTPNRLFRYDGSFPTVEIGSLIGLGDSGDSFCIAIGDIDNDGDLDIVLQNHAEGIKILVNHINDTPDGLHNYLKVKLAGLGPNHFAVGARIDIDVAGNLQSRQVFAGIGFKSTSSYVQHFGLGSATTLDRLTVTWPGGSQTTLTGVSANQTLTVTQTVEVGIPTVSGWGLIATSMLLLAAGTVILRQPRRAVVQGLLR